MSVRDLFRRPLQKPPGTLAAAPGMSPAWRFSLSFTGYGPRVQDAFVATIGAAHAFCLSADRVCTARGWATGR